MDWSKIKTIFILSFLILDIYLMYEFIKLRSASQYEIMAETSFEKQLKTDEIEVGELPRGNVKDQYLGAIPKVFFEDELKKFKKSILKDQKVTIFNQTTLNSQLKRPIKLSDKFESIDLTAFISNYVLYGNQYRFFEADEKNKTITYYQQFEEKMFYKNLNGELTFYFNDHNELLYYRQSLLEQIKPLKDEEKVLEPIEAIETLYEKGMIKPNSKITDVKLGYYTLVHLTSSQVLTPVWKVVVNNEENLFVNAFEGQMIQLNNEDKKIVE